MKKEAPEQTTVSGQTPLSLILDEVLTSGDAPVNCARKALAAIGIEMPGK